jgi:hypothetical protein
MDPKFGLRERLEAKIETTERKLFSSVAGCTRKGRINTKIRE